jgi:hypothetical protein
MGVEARCCPSKSAAHHRHMKWQPFLCNGCPCCGHCYCNCRHHLRCRCQLCCCCRCRCRCLCNHPLPSLLPLAIALAVAVNHRRCHLCRIPISHHCCRHPCRWPFPSLSPLAITVAIDVGHHRHHAVGHFQELLPWRGKNCIQPIEAKNSYLILFCSDNGQRID